MACVETACTTLIEKRTNTTGNETQKMNCATGDSTSSKLNTFWAVCVCGHVCVCVCVGGGGACICVSVCVCTVFP